MGVCVRGGNDQVRCATSLTVRADSQVHLDRNKINAAICRLWSLLQPCGQKTSILKSKYNLFFKLCCTNISWESIHVIFMLLSVGCTFLPRECAFKAFINLFKRFIKYTAFWNVISMYLFNFIYLLFFFFLNSLSQGSATFNVKREPFWPLSYWIKFTWSHKIFDAQIKKTRHIAKVLYSFTLQGRGIAIISEVRGTEMSNVVVIIIIINIIICNVCMYVCIIDKKCYLLLLIGYEIKYTAGQ